MLRLQIVCKGHAKEGGGGLGANVKDVKDRRSSFLSRAKGFPSTAITIEGGNSFYWKKLKCKKKKNTLHSAPTLNQPMTYQ